MICRCFSWVGAAVLIFLCVMPVRAAQEVTVSAASSLTNAFTEIKGRFERLHPDIIVHTNFAASNPLLKQMQEGAPVDVFASADQVTMDKAESGKLIDPATRIDFALNDLVLVVPSDSSVEVGSISDLALPKVRRIAVGNPDSVPAGRYAREALQSAGLWEELQPKYIWGASVRQALDYVRRGEVEAGFVYRTDALIGGDTLRIAAVAEGHTPVSYPIAIASSCSSRTEAELFVNFVLSSEGQAILAEYGFSKP